AVEEQWSRQQCIEGCARHGITGISPWRDKLAEYGVRNAAKHIRDVGLAVTGLCRGGMFPAPDAAGRQAAIDDNRRAIDDAAALGAQCLVLVVGGMPQGSKDLAGARSQVQDGIAGVREYARAATMPLATGPRARVAAAVRAAVRTLAQALAGGVALGSGPGDAQLGVAVGVYHVWGAPQLKAQVERAAERILAFHICDWLVPTTDPLLDRG